MAVEQHFTFPLPITTLGEIDAGDEMVTVTLDRHAAAALHSELGDALGFGHARATYAVEPTAAESEKLRRQLAEFYNEEDEMPEDDEPVEGPGGVPLGPGRTLTVEQMAKNMERQLAAEQVASRRGQSVVDGLNRGSGIGSGQR